MHSLLIAIPDWLSRIASLLEVDAAELTRNLVRVAVIWALCYVALRLVRLVATRIGNWNAIVCNNSTKHKASLESIPQPN